MDVAPAFKYLLLVLAFLSGWDLSYAQDFTQAQPFVSTNSVTNARSDRFEWTGALVDASIFMGIEHGFRLVKDSHVRRALRGPFFSDYIDSVRNIGGWSDGDNARTNYIGHPFSGSIVGFIQVRHDPRYRVVEFGDGTRYWKSRMKAMAFTAAYSLEFEIGPVSEASIGNIQQDPRKHGVVDWVITPTLGTAWMVAEDLTDRYVIRALEQHTRNRAVIYFARSFLNPTRSLSNLLSSRRPWTRDDRPGVDFISHPGTKNNPGINQRRIVPPQISPPPQHRK
jgi:hypothetical protein